MMPIHDTPPAIVKYQRRSHQLKRCREKLAVLRSNGHIIRRY
ncbi:MAG: hypothetical protein AB1589_02030 [Cyanobacteriota bacterium]